MLTYATREMVQDALEIVSSARSNAAIDRALEAGRSIVDGLLHRKFYPKMQTIRFDWPRRSVGPTWTLRLDGNHVVSLTALTAGGENIYSGAFLRRDDELDEPPYNQIQVDLSGSLVFQSGDTFQRSINATVVTGYNATDTAAVSCALGGNINSSVTTAVLNPVSGVYNVGVGSLIYVDTEYLILTDRRMSDTGQNLQSNMDDLQSDRVVDVTDGTAFAVGETLLLGSERMKITDIAGNNLIVDRAWDGTVLASHTAPVDVYALRTFTVQRGAIGSTAGSHTTDDNIYTHEFPALITSLNLAEALVIVSQETSNYARQAGAGSAARETAGEGITDIRNRAVEAFGRLSRSAAI